MKKYVIGAFLVIISVIGIGLYSSWNKLMDYNEVLRNEVLTKVAKLDSTDDVQGLIETLGYSYAKYEGCATDFELTTEQCSKGHTIVAQKVFRETPICIPTCYYGSLYLFYNEEHALKTWHTSARFHFGE